jgi:hypothetical protein
MQRIILFLLSALISFFSWAQQTIHSHVVDDETGEAIPYATVYVHSGLGTLTNSDGDFTISCPTDGTVQITCIGYTRQSFPVTSVPKLIRLQPLSTTLKEVNIIPTERILLQVSRKLAREYNRKKRKTGQYFYRTTTTYPNRKELVEAFTRANTAVNLRDLIFLRGHRGQVIGNTLQKSTIENMNFHHSMELGPMLMGSPFWKKIITPLHPNADLSYFANHYELSHEILRDEGNHQTYKIHMRSKEQSERSALEGDLFIDADTYSLLRFDGTVRNMELDVRRDMHTESTPVEIKVHVGYSHKKGFTKVSDISCIMQAGDLINRSLLYCIDDLKLHLRKGQKASENMLKSIDLAGFDSTLWAHSNIVQRTAEEEQLVFDIREEEKVRTMQTAHQGPFRPLVERLTAFGKVIPQEKVYIHMDNTCYFLGDTIWFSAYTRNTIQDLPSRVSGVLYVELFNQDGYLMERKLIEMKEGRGNGFFALNNSAIYGGMYELRAYTRWQLNWGHFQHPHSRVAASWFINQKAEQDYYRDYEKLYSRVFPVYDKPKQPGQYNHDMTHRTMRRYFRHDMDKHMLTLHFFPEGGHLVAGMQNRIAFECTWNDGQWVDGWLRLGNDSIRATHRGRGTFEFKPQLGKTYVATFLTADGDSVSARLPEAESQGVTLRVFRTGQEWQIRAQVSDSLALDSLAMTIMREGVVEEFLQFPSTGRASFSMPCNSNYPAGVHQVTVFDTRGRVWADRLFFMVSHDFSQPTLSINGLHDQYKPYEQIDLDLHSTLKQNEGTISVAVRDVAHQDQLFDDGNILTEMLLSSEIRGFVPNPRWYFERDDDEHHQGLELLMMTQGWRRFNWRDMAVRGEWDLTMRDERTPLLVGELYDNTSPWESYTQDNGKVGRIRDIPDISAHKSMLVHAELIYPDDANHPVVEEKEVKGRDFRLQLPRFYGPSIFFLAASDSTKWRKGHTYQWTQMAANELDIPDGYRFRFNIGPADCIIRIVWPYPRFTKPYDFYQSHISSTSDTLGIQPGLLPNGTRVLKEVSIGARSGGHTQFDDSQPVLILDAYEAYNNMMDAGLLFADEPIARTYVGDYGLDWPYVQHDAASSQTQNDSHIYMRRGISPTRRALEGLDKIPQDSIYAPKYLRSYPAGFSFDPGEELEYHDLSCIDKYVIYTDYKPRLEGNIRYRGDNLPEFNIAQYPYPDGSKRVFYRDRRYILPGFSQTAQFYSPDYSRMSLPEMPQDYRRTLYWNPALPLDQEGHAHITLWNNSKPTQISVKAEGQTTDGKLLWNE